MTTTIETRTEALRRLAQVARESGVRLLRDDAGEMWTTSVSEPGWLYKVEPDRCGCRGFAMYRRCRHVAALLSHLGYFDPEPESTPISAAAISPCAECGGLGEVQDLEVRQFGRFAMQWAPCSTCQGTGKRLLDHAA
jgi:hypothetical protein